MPEEVVVPASRSSSSSAVPGLPQQKQMQHKITDYSGLYVRRPHERVSQERQMRWCVTARVREPLLTRVCTAFLSLSLITLQGFIVNWDLENQILSRAFHRSVLDPLSTLSSSASSSSSANLLAECSLLATVPLLAPPTLLKDLDENLMEKWGVKCYRRITPPALAQRQIVQEMYPSAAAAAASAAAGAPSAPAIPALSTPGSREALHRLCALVVDSGYSFTHVCPVYQGKVIKSASKR